ncbi:hypothetical protein NNRS527_01383 [Nitrosospira sp. NRS527]|nr:hypothetical protein NNRS527_01383 [Nitrosospira sp. NRS527]
MQSAEDDTQASGLLYETMEMHVYCIRLDSSIRWNDGIFPSGVYSDIILSTIGFQIMPRNRRTKRFLSVLLLILGGMMMFLAPENIWIGAILFMLGLALEIAGLVLRRDK